MIHTLSTLTLTGALVLSIGVAAHAQTPAYTLANTTGTLLSNGPFTLGSEFTPNSTVVVLALGVFDDSQDGLTESHAVGLWDSAGNLLASTTVAAGTVDPLINQFRYAFIAPVVLAAGQTYETGAVWHNNIDPMLFEGDAVNFATDSRIAFVQNSYIAGGSLADPNKHASSLPSYFGPNMLLQPGTTPEPGACAMLASLSLTGAAFLRRRRMR